MELSVDPAGRIRQEQDLDPHLFHQADGKDHFLHGISLIIVHSSLHDHSRDIPDISQQESTVVPLDGRNRKSRDIPVRDLLQDSHIFSVAAQS